jgi:hypothetical protein
MLDWHDRHLSFRGRPGADGDATNERPYRKNDLRQKWRFRAVAAKATTDAPPCYISA